MQSIFRVIVILSVAAVLALGMYGAVQNDTVRGWLGVSSSANALSQTGEPFQRDTAQLQGGNFDGGVPPTRGTGAHGGTFNPAGLVRNLTILGGMIFGVMVIQQTGGLISKRQV